MKIKIRKVKFIIFVSFVMGLFFYASIIYIPCAEYRAFRNVRYVYNETKQEIDSNLYSMSLSQRENLFMQLDSVIEEKSFENISTPKRYKFIKLLTLNLDSLLDLSNSIPSNVKDSLRGLDDKEKKSFSNISKLILIDLMSKKGTVDLKSNEILKGSPKVLLISPFENLELKVGSFLAPPLGVYRLASYLKLFGIHVDVYDPNLSGVDGLFDLVKDTKYDFIGSSIYQPTMEEDIKIIKKLDEISPNSIFIAGGQGAAFNFEKLMQESPLQIIIRGLGEFVLLDMVMDYKAEEKTLEQFVDIPNLYIKDKNEIVSTSLINNYEFDEYKLISLAYDTEIVPYEKYWDFMLSFYDSERLEVMKNEDAIQTVRLFTASHCPMGCTFCSATNFLTESISEDRQKVLSLSAKDIIHNIDNIVKNHPQTKTLFFNDDDFMINKERIMKLCDLIIKKYGRKRFKIIALGRVDRIDTELLKKMKEAGFIQLNYGIESFSNKILEDMNKSLNKENAVKNIELTLDNGITPLMSFIMFYPTVTLEDVKETIDTAVELVDKGARLSYWPYVEAFEGASIMDKGYDEEKGIIIPRNKTVRKVASKAIELKSVKLKEIRERYNWPKEIPLPHVVDVLTFFKAVYEAADLSPERIEEVINKIMDSEVI